MKDVTDSRFSHDPSRPLSESSEPGRPPGMEETPERGYTAAVRPPRMRIRRIIIVAVVVLAAGLVAIWRLRGAGGLDCKTASRTASDGIAVTVCQRELSYDECSDGIDNDGNGFVDCADFGCNPQNGTKSPACL